MAPPGEDPVIGEAVPSDETCTTPFAFRVMAQTGSSTSRTVNIAADGTAQFGDIQSISTFLTAERSLGLYRDGGSIARFGYAINGSSAGQAAFLNWHNGNTAPLHIGFGSSMSNQQNHLTIASDGRVDVGDRARFKTNGDVGIGTQNPETALHIVNTEDAPDEGATGKIQGLLVENNGTRSKDYALEIRTALSNELDGRVFTVSNSGTVHIGSNLNWNTPNFENTSFNLYVEDGIRAEAIRIDLAEQAGWADYVFDDNYNPLSIEALRRYIKTNKKLPEVPSTEVLEKNGIDVSSMMALQMKKIEELTLYILELEKRIKKLERDAK